MHSIAVAVLFGAFIAQETKGLPSTLEYVETPAIYAPGPKLAPKVRARHLCGKGLFALHIRPDGAVSAVQTVQSTGHAELDMASIAAFSKWRFNPGEFKVVRVPINYTGSICR
jgi:TonB family protein